MALGGLAAVLTRAAALNGRQPSLGEIVYLALVPWLGPGAAREAREEILG
jgi:hypothetical protein